MARVCEQPVKCPGRCCNTSPEDKDQVKQLGEDFSSGLRSTVDTRLPGKLKPRWLQFHFLPWILWKVLAAANIKRWLRVLQCPTTTGLYRDGNGIPKLPLSGLTEEFQRATSRLQVTPNNSQDVAVKKNTPTWQRPAKAVEEATRAWWGKQCSARKRRCWGNSWLPS